MNFDDFSEISPNCFVRTEHIESFAELGLCELDDFVHFSQGEGICLGFIAKYRNRRVFTAGKDSRKFYIKTYNRPPVNIQLANWLSHNKRASTAAYDYLPSVELAKIGIKTPRVAAFGEQFGRLFEKKSFIITEEIIGAKSLEEVVPPFFAPPFTPEKLKSQREFIESLAKFSRNFHGHGFYHRDYYLCHIFWGQKEGFEMIDLQRVFKPVFFKLKFRIKDIAQLYFSAPSSIYSRADRLRFYKTYTGKGQLSFWDRCFIRLIKGKIAKMAAHDEKRGRAAPYKS